MSIFWQEFFLKLVLALGKVIFAKVSEEAGEYYREWKSIEQASERALKYIQTVKNPDSSREDRRRAEDEFLS